MRTHYPQHHALVATLAYTGLRFCHASALRWEDWDEESGVLRVVRKHFRGEIGPVSRKKQAPKEYPVEPELTEILREHRQRMLREQAKGLEGGWMFPSTEGTLRTPNSLDRAWARCLKHATITKRFTVHGLRYTFTDLVRRANVDAVVRRALTGHVTEEMQRHYSTVGLDEKRAAIAGVLRLVPPEPARRPAEPVGPAVGPSLVPPQRWDEAMMKSGFPTRNGANGHRCLVPPRSVSCRLSSRGSGTSGGTTRPNSGVKHRKYRAGYRIRTGDLQLGNKLLAR